MRLKEHACKHALPLMRAQKKGAIVNMFSLAQRENCP
jgi:NADP-dependent 3-hydroxy acid dehydrogenase YdfG